MKVGLLGKRYSGKTVLFEALSNLKTGEGHSTGLTNIATVKVKDAKIDELSTIFKPKKTTYAEFTLIDYNRSQDASDAILGSPALIAKYRELDAVVLLLGVLEDTSKALSELDDLLLELNLSDIGMLEAKIQRMKKASFDKQELALYENIINGLEANKRFSYRDFEKHELKLLSSFQLFALKPMIVAVNVTEDVLTKKLELKLEKYNIDSLVLSAEIENELNKLGDSERLEFMKELGIETRLSDRFINTLYETMDMISFYTVGEDEVRAWSITRGDTALTSAGKIHSDIERGFIKASVMSYDDFMKYRDEKKAQLAGVVRNEGKEYIVQPADIIHFKFNV